MASASGRIPVVESPRRTTETLAAMVDAFGADRPAALCRELTKTHEEIVRETLGGLVTWVAAQEQGVRGEVTLVVAGGTRVEPSTDDLRALVAQREAEGLTRRDAIAEVVRETGMPRRAVYAAAHTS